MPMTFRYGSRGRDDRQRGMSELAPRLFAGREATACPVNSWNERYPLKR
jgi:hypothetical protein